jgi:hypothetical protein
MVISRAIKTAALAGLTSLALLIPAGSAHAVTLHESPFCVWSSGSTAGITLKPGQRCSFWPLPTARFLTWATVVSGGRSGRICSAITQFPGYVTSNALNDAGQVDPSAWICYEMRDYGFYGSLLGFGRVVENGFGAVYGQATVLNFSTATIRFYDATSSNQNSVFTYY